MRISDWSSDVCSSDLLITFFGGCAGGTGGGVKVIRLVLFIKQAGRETRHLIHPSAEVPIKIENKVVPDAVVYAIGGFFSVYIGATILLTCIMIGTGLDPLTALSAVAGAINNTGPGLNSVVDSVASIGTIGK